MLRAALTHRRRALCTSAARRVTLFWDGGCPLCRKEIDYYKRIDVAGRVAWVDIDAHPEALVPHGIAPDQAIALIHALDARGTVQVGIPAFLAVWEQLPAPWSWLPPLLRTLPGAQPIASAAYGFWAKHRLRITGRARELSEGSACARPVDGGAPACGRPEVVEGRKR